MKITKEQAQEMIKKMGCVEITRDEYHHLKGEVKGKIWYDSYLYFKQKEVFPKVFKGYGTLKIEVDEDRDIYFRQDNSMIAISFDKSKEALYKAVEESKRITESK